MEWLMLILGIIAALGTVYGYGRAHGAQRVRAQNAAAAGAAMQTIARVDARAAATAAMEKGQHAAQARAALAEPFDQKAAADLIRGSRE